MADAGRIKKSFLFLLFCALLLPACAGGREYQAGGKGLAVLKKVDVVDNKKNTDVIITTDKPVVFTMSRQQEPPKLTVDLAGVEPGAVPRRMDVDKGPVFYILTHKAKNAKNITRVEIALNTNAENIVTQDKSAIHIILSKTEKHIIKGAKEEAKPKPKAAPPASAEKIAEAPSANPPKAKPEETKAATSAAPAARPVLPEARTLTSVSFFKEGDVSGVRLEGDGAIKNPDIFRLGPDRLVVDLAGMGSIKSKETFEVRAKVLKRVRMALHKEPPGKVRIVLDVKGPYEYDVKNAGRILTVSVFPSGAKKVLPAAAAQPAARKAEVSKPASKPAPEAKNEAANPVPVHKSNPAKGSEAKPVNIYVSRAGGKTTISSKQTADAVPADSDEVMGLPKKKYTGGKISFDIQDADLDKVIKLLADVAGLNLIMDPSDVRGKVTMKLDNVPWDQALDTLLRIYNLDKEIQGNVMRVASKAKLDAERRRELQQEAEQKKLEMEAENLYTETFKINFSKASDLEPKIKKVLSSRGDIIANESTNELIVTDIPQSLDKAKELIKILDKQVKEILIESRIVTVDVNALANLGTTWSFEKAGANNVGAVSAGGSTGQSSGVQFVPPGGTPPPGNRYIATVPASLIASGGAAGGWSWLIGHEYELAFTLQALESENKAETLAAPKVITLENKSATIVQGTTLYVQTTSAAGTAPSPLNANLSLTVTPRVTGNGYISMDIVATDNSPSSSVPAGSTASIDTKSVTTSVIVKNGDTLVLGGIYQKTKSKNIAYVPLLGKIPILGWLFKQYNSDETTSELLIFITPKLLKTSSL